MLHDIYQTRLNCSFLFCRQKQLAQFDAETQEKVAQAELDALPSLEVKHAHGRLELRERQLQELAGTMNELSTEEVSYCFTKLSYSVHYLSVFQKSCCIVKVQLASWHLFGYTDVVYSLES